MGRIPSELRETIAQNIKQCRLVKYPGRGGEKRCAEAFGVSPQQWSPWERGMRTPDELRLTQLADFFGVTVEYMRCDNSTSDSPTRNNPTNSESVVSVNEGTSSGRADRQNDFEQRQFAPSFPYCPFYRPPKPGQPLTTPGACAGSRNDFLETCASSES